MIFLEKSIQKRLFFWCFIFLSIEKSYPKKSCFWKNRYKKGCFFDFFFKIDTKKVVFLIFFSKSIQKRLFFWFFLCFCQNQYKKGCFFDFFSKIDTKKVVFLMFCFFEYREKLPQKKLFLGKSIQKRLFFWFFFQNRYKKGCFFNFFCVFAKIDTKKVVFFMFLEKSIQKRLFFWFFLYFCQNRLQKCCFFYFSHCSSKNVACKKKTKNHYFFKVCKKNCSKAKLIISWDPMFN